ncbi:DUF983 domain-containing protein [Pelagibacterium mangrovi]|uniref:DUF983 domain-containing protein n=1 Tax=Pelagibacterium mangrovi TaxID=3119828 RepID=UPI002FC83483
MMTDTPTWKSGLLGRCPHCGEGHLFAGFLRMRDKCEVCGLDYKFADPADGPAFFVMMFGCIPVVIFGLWMEVSFRAPMWVHLVTTLPLLFLTCVPPLRPIKGLLIAHQYKSKAEEIRADQRLH